MVPHTNVIRYLVVATGAVAVLGTLWAVSIIYLPASQYDDDDIVTAKQCTDADTAASIERLEKGGVIKEDLTQTPVTENVCDEIKDRALLVSTNLVARATEVERVVQELRIIQDSMRAADENRLASRPTDSSPPDKDLAAGSPLSPVEISLLSFSLDPGDLAPAPADQNNYTHTLSKEKTTTVYPTSESVVPYQASGSGVSDGNDLDSNSQKSSQAEQNVGGSEGGGGGVPGSAAQAQDVKAEALPGGKANVQAGDAVKSKADPEWAEAWAGSTAAKAGAKEEEKKAPPPPPPPPKAAPAPARAPAPKEEKNRSAEKPIDSPATPAISSDAREAIKNGASPKEAVAEAQVAGENAGASEAAAAAGAKNAVSLALIDGTLTDSVVKGHVAYNTPPKEMRWQDSADIELVLRPSTSKSIDNLEQKIKEVKETDDVTVTPVEVSKRMEATLFSSPEGTFDVSSMTGESQQPVISADDTEWRWKIVASNTGDNDLYLSMGIGLSSPQGELLGFRSVEGFPVSFEKISVKGTLWQNVSNFASSNWQWLWTAIVVPLVAFLWGRRRQSSKSGDKGLAGSSWQWFRTTIVVPVAAFLRRRRRQSSKNRDAE